MAIDFLEPFLCGQKGHKHQPKAVSAGDALGGTGPVKEKPGGFVKTCAAST